MAKAEVVKGTINVQEVETVYTIHDAHVKIKSLVTAYNSVKDEVLNTTTLLKSEWVGEGRNEFESQYELLMSKIEDFGDTLADIYDALVEAEASYEATDDSLRQNYVMSTEG